MISCKNNSMLMQSREAHFQPKLIIQILLFLVVFVIANSITSVFLVVPIGIGLFTDKEFIEALNDRSSMSSAIEIAMAIMEKPWFMLVSLFSTVITTASCIFYCLKIERRSLASMGFRKQGGAVRYLKGYAIGTAMLFLCAFVLWLMGEIDFAFSEKIPVFWLAAFFVGFVIQGMSEEVLVRGYFMVSLCNRCHTAIAVIISSVAFSLLHLGNEGVTLLALLNVTLFGVFMAVYILRTDDILGACAIHSAWNFAQGNLIGVRVSGSAPLPTVAVMTPVGEMSLFHGGDFGLEGGLVVTVMLLAVIALTVFLPQKSKD